MKSAWRETEEALFARGFKKATGGVTNTFTGLLKVGRINVEIELSIPDYDFIKLPEVRLCNIDELPRPIRGHLSQGDVLCYAVRETFLLDRFQAARSIALVLDQAVKTLEILLHGNPTPEIMAELPAYWGGVPYTFIDDPRHLRTACLGLSRWPGDRSVFVGAGSNKRLLSWCKKAGATFEAEFELPVFQAKEDVKPAQSSTSRLAGAVKWLNEQDGVRYKLDAFRSSETMREPGAIVVGPKDV